MHVPIHVVLKSYTKSIKNLISNDQSFQTKINKYIQKTRPKSEDFPAYGSTECEVEMGGPGNCQSDQDRQPARKRVADPKNESTSKGSSKGAKDRPRDKDPVTTIAVYKPILFH